MASLDKIFEIVKAGPVLPIEVASKTNMDSFLAKAFLSQLADAGKIKATAEKVGDTPIYYVPGHEVVASSRVKKLLESVKVAAKNFAQSVPEGPELQQKRTEFLARLKEIEQKEQQLAEKKAEQISKQALKVKKEPPKTSAKIEQPKLAKAIPKIEPKLAEPEPEMPPQGKLPNSVLFEKPALLEKVKPGESELKKQSLLQVVSKVLVGEESPHVQATLAYLKDAGAEILSKELKKRGKEAEITATIPSSIGPMKFLVFVVNKKTIADSDLSLAYSAGMERKLPVLVFSDGKLTKAAQNYMQAISGVVKFKQIE